MSTSLPYDYGEEGEIRSTKIFTDEWRAEGETR